MNIVKYIKLSEEKLICSGEASYVADVIYNNKNLLMIPSLDDQECLLNSILIDEYKIGYDLGQIELAGQYVLDELEKALSMEYNTNYLNKQNNPFLHEVICQGI